MVEMTTEEQNKHKMKKKIEDNLRELWDNSKHTNIQILGVSGRRRKKERAWEDIWKDDTWKLL